MKTIQAIDVKVTYSVGLGNFEMPELVFQQLKEIEEKELEFNSDLEMDYPDAWSWLNSQISDRDAYVWKYEINELSE